MRLLKHVVANKNALRDLLNKTELWFVPVANPDGYDFTFTEGNRLWRKNLRDVNGDGQITTGDGVDPNRNFPSNFHYDEEGSSSEFASETYRGPEPFSEPETQANNALFDMLPELRVLLAGATPSGLLSAHRADGGRRSARLAQAATLISRQLQRVARTLRSGWPTTWRLSRPPRSCSGPNL